MTRQQNLNAAEIKRMNIFRASEFTKYCNSATSEQIKVVDSLMLKIDLAVDD